MSSVGYGPQAPEIWILGAMAVFSIGTGPVSLDLSNPHAGTRLPLFRSSGTIIPHETDSLPLETPGLFEMLTKEGATFGDGDVVVVWVV